MSLKQLNTRAKSIRRSKPGMSWHDAQRAAAAQMRSGRAKPKARTHKAAAVAKTRKRHHVGSTAAVGATRKRKTKKRGWFGATSVTTGRLQQIGEIAVGVGLGAAATHIVLRPIEHKITERYSHPYVAKAMPWAEIVLGGMMYLKSSNSWIRNAGLGVMSGGVHGAMKELPFHMPSPADAHQAGISGGDYVSTRIPVNGTTRDMIAGLIQQDGGYVKTPTVGASIVKDNDGRPVYTSTVGARYSVLDRTSVVGDYDSNAEEDMILFNSDRSRR